MTGGLHLLVAVSQPHDQAPDHAHEEADEEQDTYVPAVPAYCRMADYEDIHQSKG
jgi:hypothetical protein